MLWIRLTLNRHIWQLIRQALLFAGIAHGFSLPARADLPAMDYAVLQDMFNEPVTASAIGIPQRASETPVTMTIISADQIRRSGSRSLAQILAQVPGLDILQSGINVFDVAVRGYQQPFQPRLLVLVDGRQVFIDDYSRTLWDNIAVNIDDIRQIEVVKGAASALFGSNAAGGVINIVTYSPLFDENRVINATAGSQSTASGDATLTTHGAWGGFKVSAGALRQDEFNTARYVDPTAGYPCCDQFPPQRPYHNYVTGSAILPISERASGLLEATFSRSAGNTGDPTSSFMLGGQRAETFSLRGGGLWQSPLGDISLDNYFNRSMVNLFEPNDNGQPYSFTTNLWVSNLTDLIKPSERDIFRVSLDYRRKSFHFAGAQDFAVEPILSETNLAAAVSWVHRLSDHLTATLAARLDHLQMNETGSLIPAFYFTTADYSHSDNAWSGNADLVWAIDADNTIKGGYGRGIQMPSFMQSQYGEITSFIGTPSVFPGNPQLKPTIVQDLSLSFDHVAEVISSTVSLSPYYLFNQDIVGPFLISMPELVNGIVYSVNYAGNIGNSQGYGGEVQLQGHRQDWHWDLSYSYSHVNDSPAFTAYNQVSYAHSTPSNHFNAAFGYSKGGWELDATLRALTRSNMLRSSDGGLTSHFVATPAYFTLGARIAYSTDQLLTFALDGISLQSHNQQTSAYPDVQRQILASVTRRF